MAVRKLIVQLREATSLALEKHKRPYTRQEISDILKEFAASTRDIAAIPANKITKEDVDWLREEGLKVCYRGIVGFENEADYLIRWD